MYQPQLCKILISFSTPNTPKRVEKDHGIKKLKLRPFLTNGLLMCLNPYSRKGRLYTITDTVRRKLKLQQFNFPEDTDWNLIGWLKASPRQRIVVFNTLALDANKRSSEEIRIKALKLNQSLTRISTKTILNELVKNNLAETCINNRKRYYWISGKGNIITKEICQNGNVLV